MEYIDYKILKFCALVAIALVLGIYWGFTNQRLEAEPSDKSIEITDR